MSHTPQLERVLSAIYRGDAKTLGVLQGLRLAPGKKDAVSKASDAIFPGEPCSPALCCFLTLVACGEETMEIIVEELKNREITVNRVLPEVFAVIEEECKDAKEKLARIAAESLEHGGQRRKLLAA